MVVSASTALGMVRDMVSNVEPQASPSTSSGLASGERAEPQHGTIMWHVYIAECVDKTLYTGVTKGVPRRLKEHNSRKGGSYTRVRTPVKIVYQEPKPTYSSALKREAQIKRWSKDKKLALIKGDFDHLSKLSISRDQ